MIDAAAYWSGTTVMVDSSPGTSTSLTIFIKRSMFEAESETIRMFPGG